MRKSQLHHGEIVIPKATAGNPRIYVPPRRAPRLPRNHFGPVTPIVPSRLRWVYVLLIALIVVVAKNWHH